MSERRVGILVARMGSSRIPGKALLEVCGKPVLEHVLNVARVIGGLSELCIATGEGERDDPVAALAASQKVRCIRGDPERLLDRIRSAAVQTSADAVVHLQGDCPFLDPQVTTRAIESWRAEPCDYLCNYEPPTFPEGLDVNIVARRALEIAWQEALAPSQRVHPYSFITLHRERFQIRNFEMSPDLSRHHWSLDFPQDIEFVRAVYERLYAPGSIVYLEDVLHLIETDDGVRQLDRALLRPKVDHAFWNSPGIVRDMSADIGALRLRASGLQEEGRYAEASVCYDEIGNIAGALDGGARSLALGVAAGGEQEG